MRIAILDDYQDIFESFPAIERLRHKTAVNIYTEKFASKEALIHSRPACFSPYLTSNHP